jgi:hypothetical protein
MEDLSVGSGSIIGNRNMEEFFTHISMHEEAKIPIPCKLLGLSEAFENNFDWIFPENLFDESSVPKHDHKGSSKNYVDEIHCLIDKTSAVDLNASSENT